jgi:hypothetical protein
MKDSNFKIKMVLTTLTNDGFYIENGYVLANNTINNNKVHCVNILYLDNDVLASYMRVYLFSIDKNSIFVADEIDKNMGKAIHKLYNQIEQYQDRLYGGEYMCYIQLVYVQPEYRNMYIGTLMVKQYQAILHKYYGFDIFAVIAEPIIGNIIIENEQIINLPKETDITEEDNAILDGMRTCLKYNNYKTIDNYYYKIDETLLKDADTMF